MKTLFSFFFLLSPFIIFSQEVDTRGTVITADRSLPQGSTYAIVIGISNYKEVTPLKYADRDAEIFAKYLLNKDGMGLDSANVKLYLNEQATLGNIGNALSDIIIKNLKKGDKVIFFFAGHGDFDANILKDQALLLLYGAPKKNYFQNIFSGDFISTADLNSRFIEPLTSKGCDILLFIDACHATGLNQNLSGGTEGGKITTMALQNMTSAVKIYSCKSDQYSLESEKWGGGRGLFSFVLMDALYGLADADQDKVITLLELQRYLEDNIPKMAAPHQQFPIVKIENSTQAIAKVNEQLLSMYKKKDEAFVSTDVKLIIKAEEDKLQLNIDSLHNELYDKCYRLINEQDLDAAYTTFLLLEKTDRNSDISLQLRRNLSDALLQKTGNIIDPLFKDISNWSASNTTAIQADKDLEKAAVLLGEKHILFNNIQARRLFLKAQVMELKNGNTNEEAIKYLEQSITLEPNAPYTYFFLARRYHLKKDLEKAKEYFNTYVELIPSSAWAYNNLGWVYYDLKEYEVALENFNKAIALNQTYDVAYNNAGNAYALLKNYDEAIKNYSRSIELNPDNAVTFNNLGNAYADLKNYTEAINYINKSLELNPNNGSAYNNLGRAYLYLDNYEEAVINYKKALQLRPDNQVIYKNLGSAYMYLKNYSEAINVYKKLIELNPDCAECYYNACAAYSMQNDPVSSLSYFEQALKKNFKSLQKIGTDTDINNIRREQQFKEIIEKYFTEQELAKYPRIFVSGVF